MPKNDRSIKIVGSINKKILQIIVKKKEKLSFCSILLKMSIKKAVQIISKNMNE
jgi:hypothetical protein